MDPTSSAYADIPTRPMRVKVYYSFDQDNKTNHLARLSNTLQIPAVAINESAQVGVIGLRQCIQAIVSASPELIPKLSNGDFTIYAFDYSEDDTPLVGQGMLSAALIANPSTTASETMMITGRVCSNLPALFNNGVKEILEVKLRLVPVPAQKEFAKNMDCSRGVSPATSAGFDPQAWSASLQQNRLQLHSTDYFNFESNPVVSGGESALVDEIMGLGTANSVEGGGQQSMGGVGMAQTRTDPAFGLDPAFSYSAPGSRMASPMMGLESSTQSDQLRHQSFPVNASSFTDQYRPDSRASMRSEVHVSGVKRRSSAQPDVNDAPTHEQDSCYNEDGQSRKRAKVIQADWRGRSSFGAKSGDLRVTAATAHSMQMHRPVARHATAPRFDLEPPPRVPTPVPQRHPMPRQHSQRPVASRSFMRQMSTATVDSDLVSDMDQFSDALLSSPEDENSPNNSITAEGTPLDIPSSPPVFHRLDQPQPSSPGLPALPTPLVHDSGYMSGGLNSENMMNDFEDDDENRSPDARDLEGAAGYSARVQHQQRPAGMEERGTITPLIGPKDMAPLEISISMETPGDMDQLPSKMLLNFPPGRYRTGSQGYVGPDEDAFADLFGESGHLWPKACRAAAKTTRKSKQNFTVVPTFDEQTRRPELLQSRRSSLALPPMPAPPASAQAIDQAPSQKSKRKYTKRSRSVVEGSDAGSPAPSEAETVSRGSRPSGLGAKRSVVLQQRLEATLANGDFPQYCSHCGAIQTTTWRKLYTKHVDGKPGRLDEVEGEGEIIGVQSLEWDEETHDTTRFIIRKSVKRTKDCTPGKDFEPVTVCNPCGLWFNKYRNMRPSDKWGRKSGSRRSKKQQGPGGTDGPATDGFEPQSEAFFAAQVDPDDAAETGHILSTGHTGGDVTGSFLQRASVRRPRANSMQPPFPRRSDSDGLYALQRNAALARAVQSSPVRSNGSQESPIEIDDRTPRPTRRLLFPSPRQGGEIKSLDDNGQASLHATSPPAKTPTQKPLASLAAGITMQRETWSVYGTVTSEKENMDPSLLVEPDEDLGHLFAGSPSSIFQTPNKTPIKSTTTPPLSQRQFDHLFKTPTPARRKRTPLSSNPNAARTDTTNSQPNMNDFMTSPTSPRYFLRSTPSRQDRTPQRSGQGHVAVDMTPFSRHLAQMLSDANDSAAAFTSPSQRAFDFSDLPTFSTPGRGLADVDWSRVGDLLSSDFAAFDDDKGPAHPSGEIEEGREV